MDNKNYNLEGPLQENTTEKSSKDKIVEDVKLLFNDVKDTKINIDKNKLTDKMNLLLRILLGLVSLSICVLYMIEWIQGDIPFVYSVPFIIVCFICSMILFFSKKKSIYKIITIILLLFLFAIEVFNVCRLYPYIF